ncbi:MAG: hypothetical protein H7145_22565, partial [Akkermansiaceae bacterium]|nr:hypothetical protein [Armatimonadota bacterium]
MFIFKSRFITRSAVFLICCGATGALISGCGGGDGGGPQTPFVVGQWQPESLPLGDGRSAPCSDTSQLPVWISLECGASRFSLRADGTYDRVSFDRSESGTWRLDGDDTLV